MVNHVINFDQSHAQILDRDRRLYILYVIYLRVIQYKPNHIPLEPYFVAADIETAVLDLLLNHAHFGYYIVPMVSGLNLILFRVFKE